MGRMGRTVGYSTRLSEALLRGPRPMSVRGLAKAVNEKYPDLRGTSYGGIRQYAEGNVRSPRIDLLRAIADILVVRWEWLAFDEGGMTEELEGVRTYAATMTATATAIRVGGDSALKLSDPGLGQEDLVTILGPVLAAAVTTLDLTPSVAASPWTEGLIEVWHRLARLGEDGTETDAQCIADALRAPLDAFGVSPARMRKNKALDGYVFAMIPVMLMMTGERQRQADCQSEGD